MLDFCSLIERKKKDQGSIHPHNGEPQEFSSRMLEPEAHARFNKAHISRKGDQYICAGV